MIEPRIERLLELSDNQYTMSVLAARRARQIIDYYTKLGAGLEEKPLPPLVDGALQGVKPLDIAFLEIVEEKIGWERPAETEDSVK